MCNLKLHRKNTALDLAENLYNKIKNSQVLDYTIIRRVNMNLCIAYYTLGDKTKAIECLNNVKPISKGTLSEFRVNYYSMLLDQDHAAINNNSILHDTIA